MMRTLSIFAGFAAALLTAFAGLAQAVSVTPNRFVLDESTQSATLTIFNTGEAPGRFLIDFIEMEMNAEGGLDPLPEGSAPANSAVDLIRYAPRRVTVAPGRSQTIRLAVRRDVLAQRAAGEYRSHLRIRNAPDNAGGVDVEDRARPGGDTVGFSIAMNRAIALPLIVRKGELTVQAALENVRAEPRGVALTTTIDGSRSVHGDLEATWIRTDGARVPLGAIRAISVLPPQTRVNRLIPYAADAPRPADGQVEVVFTASADGELLARVVSPVL